MKGARAAPFVFLGAAVAAVSALHPSPIWWTASLVFLAAGWFLSGRVAPRFTPLAIAIWAYAWWTLAHTAFLGATYTPNGLFDPVFLLAGFSVGRALNDHDARRAGALLLIGIAILAACALLQFALGKRGDALFDTPAALAAVINMALAFISVLILLKGCSARVAWLAALLFAGLCATLSRGGAVALAAAAILAWVLAGFARFEKRELARLAGLYALGALSVASVLVFRGGFDPSVISAVTPPSEYEASSLRTRLELYSLAWSTIDAPLCCGIGYLGFRWVLERGRALVPSYGEQGYTHFVHNDYLQALLELSAPGFVSLVAMAAAPFVTAVRRMPPNAEDKTIVIATVTALATMALHATVDFPFHVPVALLLFGLLAGRIDRLCTLPGERAPRWRSSAGRITLIIVAAALITLLARPVFAAAASAYGTYQWRQGEGQNAAFGLELARRLDSRDWRFHFQVGQFWFAEAIDSGEAEAARRADAAFAAAIAANPLGADARLAHVATQLRFASLLSSPADRATLRARLDEALSLAPRSPRVLRQHAELMRAVGERK